MKLTDREKTVLSVVGNTYPGLWRGAIKRGFHAATSRLVAQNLLKESRNGDLTVTPAGRAALAEQKDRTNG